MIFLVDSRRWAGPVCRLVAVCRWPPHQLGPLLDLVFRQCGVLLVLCLSLWWWLVTAVVAIVTVLFLRTAACSHGGSSSHLAGLNCRRASPIFHGCWPRGGACIAEVPPHLQRGLVSSRRSLSCHQVLRAHRLRSVVRRRPLYLACAAGRFIAVRNVVGEPFIRDSRG
jgi:hypothetical protein